VRNDCIDTAECMKMILFAKQSTSSSVARVGVPQVDISIGYLYIIRCSHRSEWEKLIAAETATVQNQWIANHDNLER
jgi:hypothetical protein